MILLIIIQLEYLFYVQISWCIIDVTIIYLLFLVVYYYDAVLFQYYAFNPIQRHSSFPSHRSYTSCNMTRDLTAISRFSRIRVKSDVTSIIQTAVSFIIIYLANERKYVCVCVCLGSVCEWSALFLIHYQFRYSIL